MTTARRSFNMARPIDRRALSSRAITTAPSPVKSAWVTGSDSWVKNSALSPIINAVAGAMSPTGARTAPSAPHIRKPRKVISVTACAPGRNWQKLNPSRKSSSPTQPRCAIKRRWIIAMSAGPPP